jgi:hypothetical protein
MKLFSFLSNTVKISAERNIYVLLNETLKHFLKLSLLHKLFLFMLILVFIYLVNRKSAVYEYYDDMTSNKKFDSKFDDAIYDVVYEVVHDTTEVITKKLIRGPYEKSFSKSPKSLKTDLKQKYPKLGKEIDKYMMKLNSVYPKLSSRKIQNRIKMHLEAISYKQKLMKKNPNLSPEGIKELVSIHLRKFKRDSSRLSDWELFKKSAFGKIMAVKFPKFINYVKSYLIKLNQMTPKISLNEKQQRINIHLEMLSYKYKLQQVKPALELSTIKKLLLKHVQKVIDKKEPPKMPNMPFSNVGCFTNIRDIDDCRRLAIKSNANTFKLHNNGQCFIGQQYRKQDYNKDGSKKNDTYYLSEVPSEQMYAMKKSIDSDDDTC